MQGNYKWLIKTAQPPPTSIIFLDDYVLSAKKVEFKPREQPRKEPLRPTVSAWMKSPWHADTEAEFEGAGLQENQEKQPEPEKETKVKAADIVMAIPQALEGQMRPQAPGNPESHEAPDAKKPKLVTTAWPRLTGAGATEAGEPTATTPKSASASSSAAAAAPEIAAIKQQLAAMMAMMAKLTAQLEQIELNHSQ
jgi:hypothetical protein